MLLQPGSHPVPNCQDYVLVQKLGAGAFGEVWHAHGSGGLDVALKFIRLDSKVRAVELRSLDDTKSIRHPNLVSVFGTWQTDGWLIVAMEKCDSSLQDRLEQSSNQNLPGIPLQELLGYMTDAANGLDALNAQHVQHRDVKPANLLLLNGGVKVADFGLAKAIKESIASNSGAGTIAYTAPECFKGRVARQSDQYSLAVSYYQLRTAQLLFNGNQAEIMYAHLESVPDLSRLDPSERAVLSRALSKDPTMRWPDCMTFVSQLRNLKNSNDRLIIDQVLHLFSSGVDWMNKRVYEMAIRDFDQAAKLLPEKAHSYIFRSLALLGKRELSAARATIQNAIRCDSTNALEVLNLVTGGGLDLQSGYGTLRELIHAEDEDGKELQNATISAVTFSLLGMLNNNPEDTSKALEAILKHARKALFDRERADVEQSNSVWRTIKSFWNS